MKLEILGHASAARGHAGYYIQPAHARVTEADIERLAKLKPKIERALRAALGRYFTALHIGVDTLSERGKLLLVIRGDTSRSVKRFELRSVFGWIRQCDSKPKKKKK